MQKVKRVGRLEKRADDPQDLTPVEAAAIPPARRFEHNQATADPQALVNAIHSNFLGNAATGLLGAGVGLGAAGLGAYALYRMRNPKTKPQPLQKMAGFHSFVDNISTGMGNLAGSVGDSISNTVTGGSRPMTGPSTNPSVTWPLIVGAPLAAYGLLQAKKKIDEHTAAPDPRDVELANAKAQFSAALNRQATLGKSAEVVPELAALNTFLDTLEKQALDLSGVPDGISRFLGNMTTNPVGRFESLYPPLATTAALGAGLAAYRLQRKSDPNKVQFEATQDAYRRMRLAKPPGVTVTTLDPNEDQKQVEGLGDANNMMITLPPALQKAAEAVNRLSPLEKVAAIVGSMIDHQWIGEEHREKLNELERHLEKRAGAANDFVNQASQLPPDQLNKLVRDLTVANPDMVSGLSVLGLNPSDPSTFKPALEAAKGQDLSGYDVSLQRMESAHPNIQMDLAPGGNVAAAPGKINSSVPGAAGIDNSTTAAGKPNAPAATTSAAGSGNVATAPGKINSSVPGAASSGNAMLDQLKGMNPLQLLSMLAGVGGMASGHPLAGLIGIALGAFGPEIMRAITTQFPQAKVLLAGYDNAMKNMGVDKYVGSDATLKGAYNAATGADQQPAAGSQTPPVNPSTPEAPSKTPAGPPAPVTGSQPAPTATTTPPPPKPPYVDTTMGAAPFAERQQMTLPIPGMGGPAGSASGTAIPKAPPSLETPAAPKLQPPAVPKAPALPPVNPLKPLAGLSAFGPNGLSSALQKAAAGEEIPLSGMQSDDARIASMPVDGTEADLYGSELPPPIDPNTTEQDWRTQPHTRPPTTSINPFTAGVTATDAGTDQGFVQPSGRINPRTGGQMMYMPNPRAGIVNQRAISQQEAANHGPLDQGYLDRQRDQAAQAAQQQQEAQGESAATQSYDADPAHSGYPAVRPGVANALGQATVAGRMLKNEGSSLAQKGLQAVGAALPLPKGGGAPYAGAPTVSNPPAPAPSSMNYISAPGRQVAAGPLPAPVPPAPSNLPGGMPVNPHPPVQSPPAPYGVAAPGKPFSGSVPLSQQQQAQQEMAQRPQTNQPDYRTEPGFANAAVGDRQPPPPGVRHTGTINGMSVGNAEAEAQNGTFPGQAEAGFGQFGGGGPQNGLIASQQRPYYTSRLNSGEQPINPGSSLASGIGSRSTPWMAPTGNKTVPQQPAPKPVPTLGMGMNKSFNTGVGSMPKV